MTPAQTQSALDIEYQAQGYVLIPHLLTPTECHELKEEGKRLLREHANPRQSVFVGAAAASPLLYKFASDPRLVEVLRQIMPEGVMFMSDKFVYKSKDVQFPTPWHQDIAYWQNTRPKLSTWIALDDVSEANGAVKVLPGSHTQLWKHEQQVSGEFGNQIRLPETAPGEVVCEMSQGSILFFSDRLVHASCPNTAGSDRYALIGTYHAPADDDSFDLSFPARHVIVAAQPLIN